LAFTAESKELKEKYLNALKQAAIRTSTITDLALPIKRAGINNALQAIAAVGGERAISIVKELIENSLDAGATEISVELTDGGKHRIKVVDDGEGMSRDDAMLSSERHATSKIYGEDDLYSVATFGFRGEALSSIASVSEFDLITKKKEAVTGVKIKVRAGEIIANRPYSSVEELKTKGVLGVKTFENIREQISVY